MTASHLDLTQELEVALEQERALPRLTSASTWCTPHPQVALEHLPRLHAWYRDTWPELFQGTRPPGEEAGLEAGQKSAPRRVPVAS